ncbi:MAG: sigma 54-interacting transcriptional regulator [Deltaproteobacteria bacterium]|nr:sigma 54-interacting transcriptional regulator [Deltaproteobacteria bacterium]
MSETLQMGQGAVLVAKEFFLEVKEGPDAGTTFGPLSLPAYAGSADANEILLRDPSVSRFHFSIKRGSQGPLIVDNESTNGTFLGKYRIRQAYLSDGAQIQAGETLLEFRVPGSAQWIETSDRTSFGCLLGQSPDIRALFAMLDRLAKVDATVLIEGETGTGKELVARALHSEGPRSSQPFVVVDCGASAPTLIESELFGHTKGAFTGAEVERKGAFELADGGTLFLDEVGELPIELQPKLLRALENGVVRPLGSSEERAVSVRVLAATHRNLRQMVNEGRFREDLYFRLAVCPVHVPPLRERSGDIAVLGRHFLARALRAAGEVFETSPRLSPDTLDLLQGLELTGNVRELRNLVERAVILGEREAIRQGDLAPAIRAMAARDRRSDRPPQSLHAAKRQFEREFLIRLLARYEGDVVAAATEAGVHVNSFHRLIRRHQLRKEKTSDLERS